MSAPGVYVLIVFLPNDVTVRAGALGRLDLQAGHYLYCGSAQGGLLPRLARHMSLEKRKHWHIDFLTCEGEVLGALTFQGDKRTECLIAATLSTIPGLERIGQGFGSSDCRCISHLYRIRDEVPLSMPLDVLRSSFPSGG